jgi:hypothetical protein
VLLSGWVNFRGVLLFTLDGRSALDGDGLSLPVRHRLSAKVSAVQTKLRRCPCLAPVLEIHRIAVTQQVARKLVKEKGLAQLPSRPLLGRVGGHIRAVSIDQIMNDVTLIRSDISRFSRGTVPDDESNDW